MNIAVCDDEKEIRAQIRDFIIKNNSDIAVETYESGDELLAANIHFDVVFLDIQMEGKNGIETAGILRERGGDNVLIFITGAKEYVFEAFDVMAFHYLLKPIKKDKFMEVFGRAVKEAEKRRGAACGNPLFLKTRNHHFTIDAKDILYIENRGRKVEVHIREKVIEAYAVMTELEKQLGIGFYRCHRGYLVNMAHIAEYDSDRILLNNGEGILLSKDRYRGFVREYMRYLRDGGAVGV